MEIQAGPHGETAPGTLERRLGGKMLTKNKTKQNLTKNSTDKISFLVCPQVFRLCSYRDAEEYMSLGVKILAREKFETLSVLRFEPRAFC